MKKVAFISRVTETRNDLDEAIRQIVAYGDLGTLVTARWSALDVIAHIVWYEEEMIYLIGNRDMTRNADIWDNPADRRNELVYAIVQGWSQDWVLDRYSSMGRELLDLLGSISQDMYDDASWYRGMPRDWRPVEVFRENTYEHYIVHLDHFRAKFSYIS